MQIPSDIVPGRLISRHGPGFLRRALLALAWWRTGPATSLDLHLNGVVVRRRATRSNEFVPFMAMADLYLCRAGRTVGRAANALAFRRSPQEAWVDVIEDHGDAFRLRGEIIEGQLRERGPLALRALEAGESLTFHAVEDAERLAKRVMGGALSARSRSFELSREGLHADGAMIPIDAIASLDEGGRTGVLRLLDARGQALWSVHYLSLFSADLFIVLMRTMIEAHHYGIDGNGVARR
jgi:hypothetical protein